MTTYSGRRWRAVYHVPGPEATARAAAEDLCIEQTVEFPADLVHDATIREHVFGHVAALRPLDAGGARFEATIDFAVEIVGGELSQLLNVLFGNISLKPGIRLVHAELDERLLAQAPASDDWLAGFGSQQQFGPRYGVAGLRKLLDAPSRPLLCTALKPMGLDAHQLAEMAYAFAAGGLDLIKDDHGLADQPFCRFEDRVERCARAVQRAERESGYRCCYCPNISAPADRILERARFARDAGARGVLVAPGLVGFDTMRRLASDDELGLVVVMHPAALGAFSMRPDEGIAHRVLYGQLARLAGADISVFPHHGGRFSFTPDDCRAIAEGCREPMGTLASALPAPAGGMSLARSEQMVELYGRDVVLLIGGDLHRHGPDLTATSRRFRAQAEALAQEG